MDCGGRTPVRVEVELVDLPRVDAPTGAAGWHDECASSPRKVYERQSERCISDERRSTKVHYRMIGSEVNLIGLGL
jgi:hypothetical protein